MPARTDVPAAMLVLVLGGCGTTSASESPARPAGPSATVAVAAAGAASAEPSAPAPRRASSQGRHVYEGTVAGKPILLRLRCEGATCSGYYFYERIGESLRLVQTGPNAFDELVDIGKSARVTGHLAFDDAPGGERWVGTFTAPPRNAAEAPKGEPIVLSRVARTGTPRWMMRSFSDKSAKPANADCKVHIRSFELVGLGDEVQEERINGVFTPERLAVEHAEPIDTPLTETCGKGGAQCDESPKGYRILCRDFNGRSGLYLDVEARPTLLDERLLSVRSEFGFDGGGAHPSDGVTGVTVDLRDGHALDARDFLKDPSREPSWESFVPPAFFRRHGGFSRSDVRFALGTSEGDRRPPVWEKLEWTEFYLTRSGFELVPGVPEVMRILRHEVQHVPFARVASALLPSGPAAHLYAR
ncbi:MAG: hypothetical protein J0I07_26160 [Myxococcales bacterium]|nr:hypothetical protein [Myxococcales bacterium]